MLLGLKKDSSLRNTLQLVVCLAFPFHFDWLPPSMYSVFQAREPLDVFLLSRALAVFPLVRTFDVFPLQSPTISRTLWRRNFAGGLKDKSKP